MKAAIKIKVSTSLQSSIAYNWGHYYYKIVVYVYMYLLHVFRNNTLMNKAETCFIVLKARWYQCLTNQTDTIFYAQEGMV